jgi:RHS repeat-associated protein
VSIDPIYAQIDGYILAYLSNENQQPVDVHFDDFTVEHVKTNVVSAQSYYPYGAPFNEFVRTASIAQSFKYQGKEWQTDNGLNIYDNEWRQYDPYIVRTTTQDPHAERYPSMSMYSWVAGNPILMIDPDGQDYGVYIDHETLTITIRAHFIGTSNSISSLNSARDYWNSQSGKNVYVVGEGENAVAYTINYDISTDVNDETPDYLPDGTQLESCGEGEAMHSNSNELNSYDVLPDSNKRFISDNSSEQVNGTSTGRSVFVKESKKSGYTGKHEVGHNLGNSHDYGGLMGSHGGSGVGPKHTAESLSGVGIGNQKIGKDASGKGKIKSVSGQSPYNFSCGKTMSLQQYQRIQNLKKRD